MNGQSSIIQKTALLGSEANRKVTVYGKRNAMSREGLGLLDLLKLRFTSEQGASSFLLHFLKVATVQEKFRKFFPGQEKVRDFSIWLRKF